jgi:hypothetical protein
MESGRARMALRHERRAESRDRVRWTRSLSDFYANRRIRSPIDQFRLSYAKFSDLDAAEKPKLRVAEQIKRKSDRLLGRGGIAIPAGTAFDPKRPNVAEARGSAFKWSGDAHRL